MKVFILGQENVTILNMKSRKRHASIMGGVQGNGEGNSRREDAVDESRKEMADRVARFEADH